MNIVIEVNGEQLPCSPSMGAMLRFKQETGKEVTEIDAKSVSELCTYLYCCVASACSREKKPFDMSLMDFADHVSPDDMAAWHQAISEDPDPDEGDGEDEEDEKKSRPGS